MKFFTPKAPQFIVSTLSALLLSSGAMALSAERNQAQTGFLDQVASSDQAVPLDQVATLEPKYIQINLDPKPIVNSQENTSSVVQSQKAKKTEKKPAVKTSISSSLIPKVLPSLVNGLCNEVGNKLGSVSVDQCLNAGLKASDGYSVQDRPLMVREYAPVEGVDPIGRVLLMGGIHGDEYSSVSLMFRWMETLNQYHSGIFHWQLVPLLNPDGLLQTPKATRQNANGVDLNRNFPTFDWGDLAQKYWVTRTYKNPRRYPGPVAASEPETQWFMKKIQEFQPEVIIAVHAPHRLVDFDGPRQPPVKLGKLELRRLGTYPGSLGNYGAHSLLLPVVTVELASAGIMPSNKEISKMWLDLVRWLKKEVPKQRQAMLKRQKRLSDRAKEEGKSGSPVKG